MSVLASLMERRVAVLWTRSGAPTSRASATARRGWGALDRHGSTARPPRRHGGAGPEIPAPAWPHREGSEQPGGKPGGVDLPVAHHRAQRGADEFFKGQHGGARRARQAADRAVTGPTGGCREARLHRDAPE